MVERISRRGGAAVSSVDIPSADGSGNKGNGGWCELYNYGSSAAVELEYRGVKIAIGVQKFDGIMSANVSMW